MIILGTSSYTVKSVKDYDFALVDVTQQSLLVTVLNAEGQELESITIERAGK